MKTKDTAQIIGLIGFLAATIGLLISWFTHPELSQMEVLIKYWYWYALMLVNGSIVCWVGRYR